MPPPAEGWTETDPGGRGRRTVLISPRADILGLRPKSKFINLTGASPLEQHKVKVRMGLDPKTKVKPTNHNYVVLSPEN